MFTKHMLHSALRMACDVDRRFQTFVYFFREQILQENETCPPPENSHRSFVQATITTHLYVSNGGAL